MSLKHFIKRTKNIFTEPKREFIRISQEESEPLTVFTTFVLPFLILYTVASYLGEITFSPATFEVGTSVILKNILFMLLVLTISIYLASFVINELLSLFHIKKDIKQTFALVSYTFTPIYIALIFSGLIPNLAAVIYFIGFYSIVLFWIATSSIFDIKMEQRQIFVSISLILIVLIFLFTRILMGLIFSL